MSFCLDLLEREQRRNAELVDKHSDLMKLQRRSNYQTQSLKQLEAHSQELETSLHEMKSMLEREKQLKSSMECEVSKLRNKLDNVEIAANENDRNNKQYAKRLPNGKEKNVHKPVSNQLDTTPSPLKFRETVATPTTAKRNTKSKLVKHTSRKPKSVVSSHEKLRSAQVSLKKEVWFIEFVFNE